MKAAGISAELAAFPPRERILAVTRDLFMARGIRGVGVEEIATAARTNKMTLYRHFESKDLLVVAYLKLLCTEADAVWRDAAFAHPADPVAQLRVWIDFVCAKLAEPNGRGCPISNAAVELPEKDHPGRAVIEEHKTYQRENILRCCRDAGFAEPETLADTLYLMLEGARINIQSVGLCGPSGRLKDTLLALLRVHPRRKH